MNQEEISFRYKVAPSTVRAWLYRGLPFLTKGGRGVPYEFNELAVENWHRINIRKDLTQEEWDEYFSSLITKEAIEKLYQEPARVPEIKTTKGEKHGSTKKSGK
jgi:hypothetical protein